MTTHNLDSPSPWVERFATLIPNSTAEQPVLDLACGSGRHSHFLAQMGHHVLAVDRQAQWLSQIDASQASQLSPKRPRIKTLEADLESEIWPLAGLQVSGLIVTNYLYRPRFAELLGMVRPSGVLIYETFAAGNEAFGKPSNPEFLLEPDELLERIRAVDTFRIVAFEQGVISLPRPASVQRICAVRSSAIPLQLPHERKN